MFVLYLRLMHSNQFGQSNLSAALTQSRQNSACKVKYQA